MALCHFHALINNIDLEAVQHHRILAADMNDPLAPAMEKIEFAKVSANDRALLSIFVLGSVKPSDAVRYVLDRASRESAAKTLEDTMLSLKDDLIALAFRSTL